MDLVWPATAWALWVAALAAAVAVAGRERSAASPPAAGEPDPVAVGELLRGMRAQEVFHATLSELAGRGLARVEGDRFALVASGGEDAVPAYQRWALERVRERLGGAAEAPLVALMPDGADLEGDFAPLVRRRAIELGLARRRWPSLVVPVGLAVALAAPWYATVAEAGVSWLGGIATMVSFVAGGSLLLGGRGFLLTARGAEVAARPSPEREWIFTGSGWQGDGVEPAGYAAGGPRRHEVAGHVVKRWYDAEHERRYLALHDGRSARAKAFAVDPGTYKDVLPGDCVRLLVRREGDVVRVLAHERHW
ncbi:hypothetical protein Nocox_04670 [Nonomuraea coxensis DSM 45129]|uniref:DUF2207 domain-containing protein n=1 Tax=Nonomuraea coxensis DSM 45129 TaxID=1122611 RepID=A0ABX8TTK0_9ACTN|nr:hypothetical protein [Nonomuraea coxensis]QYC38561.1 hypothetical protein Nocox_04670 [Nonomuraea coxensis DSM 45129]